jgi:NCS1 family nucleobase:cation symporter-1
VALLARFDQPTVVVLSLFALSVATLSTNIAANIVSPANDFSNLAPRWISFRTGGLIAGVIGIVIMPWRLVADLSDYIFVWLVGYSGLLGSIAGVMLADYYLLRRTRLDVDALYRRNGPYLFTGGFNLRALAAIALGIAPCVPGFLAQALGRDATGSPRYDASAAFDGIYQHAWFVALAIAAAAHLLLSTLFPPQTSEKDTP